MPWKESSVMDEHLRFLARVLDGEPEIVTHVLGTFCYPVSGLDTISDGCGGSICSSSYLARTPKSRLGLLWASDHPDLAICGGSASVTAKYLVRTRAPLYTIPAHLADADPLVCKFERWARERLPEGFSLDLAARRRSPPANVPWRAGCRVCWANRRSTSSRTCG
jgi:hypothetical protein